MNDYQLRYRRQYAGHCCPYCGECVGYIGRFLGWLFGVRIHGCTFGNVKRPGER